jgi:hypothetical protein
VVASSPLAARHFYEDAEGHGRGDADAESVKPLPGSLVAAGGWRDGPRGDVRKDSGWPSDALLVACGGDVTAPSESPTSSVTSARSISRPRASSAGGRTQLR